MQYRQTAALAAAMALSLGASTAAVADNERADAAARQESRELAQNAHREAVDDALIRMRASTRLDLDIELPARTRTPASGD